MFSKQFWPAKILDLFTVFYPSSGSCQKAKLCTDTVCESGEKWRMPSDSIRVFQSQPVSAEPPQRSCYSDESHTIEGDPLIAPCP